MSESIRIITEPSIFVVGRQAIDDAELARFLESVGAPGWRSDAPSAGEAMVEIGGRLCYQSFKSPRPGGNGAYLGHVLEVGHGSVCEHACWSIIVTGVSRSLTHELIRHRVGISPSQLSQRFVDESDCAFVVPPALIPAVNYYLDRGGRDGAAGPRDGHDIPAWSAAASWVGHCSDALESYRRLAGYLSEIGPVGDEQKTLRRKRAREAARSVLPNCVATQIAITANGRALRHFLELRGSIHADAEIRRLAVAFCRVLKAESPNLFADCSVVAEADGSEVVEVGHHKV